MANAYFTHRYNLHRTIYAIDVVARVKKTINTTAITAMMMEKMQQVQCANKSYHREKIDWCAIA